MSLQYIIDAYNLINHPAFKPVNKSALNIQFALADFIRFNRLTGSKTNRLILVFDGYPPPPENVPVGDNLVCMFSLDKEADELIKQLVENSASPRNMIVVSDDKEIRLASSFSRARVSGVEEFICGKKNLRTASAKVAETDFKLSFASIEKINSELRKKWLKE